MHTAETFVVRLYRRRTGSQFVGLVEVIDTGARLGFGSPEELLAILRAHPQGPSTPALYLVKGQSTRQRKKERP